MNTSTFVEYIAVYQHLYHLPTLETRLQFGTGNMHPIATIAIKLNTVIILLVTKSGSDYK
jgi:hypothetical protein